MKQLTTILVLIMILTSCTDEKRVSVYSKTNLSVAKSEILKGKRVNHTTETRILFFYPA